MKPIKIVDAHVSLRENALNCNRKGCKTCPHWYWFGFVHYGEFGTTSVYLGTKVKMTTLQFKTDVNKWRMLLRKARKYKKFIRETT